MRRGEIYWADLAPRSGSEQRGRRPVLILSHDGFNLTPGWRSVVVVPLSTSESQARRGPTAIEIAPGGALTRRSVALCHQITTLDRGKLSDYVGTLSPEDLARVEAGVKAALDLR
jgi:mRNA-degrading endonuclease toxin of MazEF toxin-antitoxin module